MQHLKSVEDLKEKVDDLGENDILLDVRTAEEFAAGSIPGFMRWQGAGLKIQN